MGLVDSHVRSLKCVSSLIGWIYTYGRITSRNTNTHTHERLPRSSKVDQIHTDTLSPWFVPLPISSAARGVSAGVRQCQLPPSASQWGPASRHLSGQLSLLSTLHCTTIRQACARCGELHAHTFINIQEDKLGHVFTDSS